MRNVEEREHFRSDEGDIWVYSEIIIKMGSR